MVGVDAEDTGDFPLFFVKRKPFLFQGQREFISKVMDLLIQASQLDEARAAKLSSFSIGFDIASAVAKAAKSVGLAPSNNADIPYTSLLILYSRHRGAPMLARLYGEVHTAASSRCADRSCALPRRPCPNAQPEMLVPV
jgi:hypothetical protein